MNKKLKISVFIPITEFDPDIMGIVHDCIHSFQKFESIIFITSLKETPGFLKTICKVISDNNFKFTIINTNLITPDRFTKLSLEYSFQENIDYALIFQKGYKDVYESFLTNLSEEFTSDYSIISSSRTIKDFSLGRLFRLLSCFLYSQVTRQKIRDYSGDSVFMIRVCDFRSKYNNLNIYSDNQNIFTQMILTSASRLNQILYISKNELTRKSHYQYNFSSLVISLKLCFLFLFNRRYFVRKKSQTQAPISNEISHMRELDLNQLEVRIQKQSQIESSKILANESFISKDKEPESNIKRDSDLVSDLQLTEKMTLSHNLKRPKEYNSFEDIPKDLKRVRLSHVNEDQKNILYVNWCLTNICNFKCTYCPESLHDGSVRGVDLETAIEFVHKITKHYEDKEIHFELTGGEVTYYKGFLELIKEIKRLGHKVAIISNGNRKIEFWEQHYQFLDRIMFSFHSEQCDPEHYKKVVYYLVDKVALHCNIMMKPENFEKCYKLATQLAKNGDMSIAMQPLLENMDGKMFDYTDYQKRILDTQTLIRPKGKAKHSIENAPSYTPRGALKMNYENDAFIYTSSPELISRNQNQWAGWSCYIGLETLCIDFNGNILRGWCGVGGLMSNLKDEVVTFPTKPILCNKKECNCGVDIMTTKELA